MDEIVTVTDDEISAAILALMEQQKLVTEGAGATAVAAAMFHKLPIQGKKVACILSGGNIDVTILSRVIKRGLLMSGRNCQLTIGAHGQARTAGTGLPHHCRAGRQRHFRPP